MHIIIYIPTVLCVKIKKTKTKGYVKLDTLSKGILFPFLTKSLFMSMYSNIHRSCR